MPSANFMLSPRWIISEAVETVRRPRDVAQRFIAADLPTGTVWEALALVVIVSVIFGQLTVYLMGAHMAGSMGMLASPLFLGGAQFVLLALSAMAIHVIGRLMGGQGQFSGALVLVTWLQVVMVCLQVLQTLAFVLLPPLGVILGYVGVVLFLWLLTNFVAVLHGFNSLGLVFAMILLSAFGLAFVFSLVLAGLGLVPAGGFNV